MSNRDAMKEKHSKKRDQKDQSPEDRSLPMCLRRHRGHTVTDLRISMVLGHVRLDRFQEELWRSAQHDGQLCSL